MAIGTSPKLASEPAAETGGSQLPVWPFEKDGFSPETSDRSIYSYQQRQPSGRDALQALLAFSALHQQVRRRRALARQFNGFETIAREFESGEQFVLDEVLQLVAERAIAITGADGLGIALAENNEVVLRASAGAIKPDVGARIQRDSAFSGACFRMAQIILCDDTETDDRVNLYACRQLGARSMVAVPLCGRRRVIGLLEAFSAEPFGFNESDVRSLELLAELVVGALKPEDEDRFAESAQVAEAELIAPAEPPEAKHLHEDAPTHDEPAVSPIIVPQTSFTTAAAVVKAATPPLDEIVSAVDALAKKKLAAAEAAEKEAGIVVQISPEVPEAAEAAEPAEAANAPERPSGHHPGIFLVLALLVVSVLVAGGVWWKLKNAQIGDMVVQAPVASTKKPHPAAAPAQTTPAPKPPEPETQTAAGTANDDQDVDAEPTENAAPQDMSKLPRITGVRHWSSADSSTVVLDLEDQVQYEAHRLANPERIYFDLHDTRLAPELEGKTIDIGDGWLARVRVAQPSAGLTRVVLETKANSTFSVSLEPNPYRLVVQVRKPGANPKAEVKLFPDAQKMAIVVPPPTKEDLQLRSRVPKMRIVVDAGHGGWDLGTVGRKGLLEKDLVLEIAQRLGKLLESRLGAEVVLTRNDDNYIPLDERASIANQSQADLFVSVHANYSDLLSARGVETYYTNFFAAPNAKELETRSGMGKDKFVTASLSSTDLHDKIEQSRRLAASVQRSLYGTLSGQNPGLRDRGVKEASYVVLKETAMPGILAEVSFVSSPTDEQKLQSDGYREQIAEALYRGIARYAASAHPVKLASK